MLVVLSPRELDSDIKGSVELGGGARKTQEVSEVTCSQTHCPPKGSGSEGLSMGQGGHRAGPVAQ